MAARFWVGGTGTWDAADTTHWAATSNGAGGSSVPGASDDVTFDGSSGGGTVTVNATIGIISLTLSAFTGTLDFATNDNNVTISGNFTNTGSGTRTLNMGDGTWSLTGGTCVFNQNGATNLTFNANGSTIAFSGTATSGNRRFLGGNRTYNIVTVNSSTNYAFSITGTNTFGTLTISAPNRVFFPAAATTTITTLTNITATSSAPVAFIGDNTTGAGATISSANNWTAEWAAFTYMTFSGGGTFAATNSLNLGNNSGITITAPSGGGVTGVIGG